MNIWFGVEQKSSAGQACSGEGLSTSAWLSGRIIAVGKDDWYRRTMWSAEDEAAFFKRLCRCRSNYHRAQYLRIQAYYLQTNHCPPDFQTALRLLDHLIQECPDENELGAAYLQRAQCLERLGRREEALNAYQLAVSSSKRDRGGYTTDAPVHYALFVARQRKRECYEEAVAALNKAEMVIVLPPVRFRALAALAMIAGDSGKIQTASSLAAKALAIVPEENMRLGGEIDATLFRHLEQIAAVSPVPWWRRWFGSP